MLKIRDLGINVVPAIESVPLHEQYLDWTYVDDDKGGGKKGGKKPSVKKPSVKKPATKKPSKKGSKKAGGFGFDEVAQLRQQLEDRIGTGH